MEKSKRSYLNDIQWIYGIAILFVAMGHQKSNGIIENVLWYRELNNWIYSFHMPLFMFASGYIFSYTMPKIESVNSYFAYLKKKFIRLFPSFLIVAILMFSLKYLMQGHIDANRGVNNGFTEFFQVFYVTTKGPAGFLWYIYVLFLYYLTIPLIIKKIDLRLIFLISSVLVLSMSLFFFNIKFTDYFSIRSYIVMLPYFSLGMISCNIREKYLSYLHKFKWIFAFLFICFSILFFYKQPAFLFVDNPPVIPKYFMGLTAIPFFHLIAINFNERIKIFNVLGKYSFSIYLLNVLCIGTSITIAIKLFKNSFYEVYYIYFIILTIIGVTVPILIKKMVDKTPLGKYFG